MPKLYMLSFSNKSISTPTVSWKQIADIKKQPLKEFSNSAYTVTSHKMVDTNNTPTIGVPRTSSSSVSSLKSHFAWTLSITKTFCEALFFVK